jgi:hypothetical protein
LRGTIISALHASPALSRSLSRSHELHEYRRCSRLLLELVLTVGLDCPAAMLAGQSNPERKLVTQPSDLTTVRPEG